MIKQKKLKYNDCPSGKNKYETEEDAKLAVRHNWLERNINLSFYLCIYCQSYHMTSKKYKK